MKRSVISKVMAEMGRKGGKAGGRKGGRARMAALSSEERSTLARKAARARWGAKSKSVANLETKSMPEAAIPVGSDLRTGAGESPDLSKIASSMKPPASGAARGLAATASASAATRSTVKPAAPAAGGFTPVSENLVAARVNAGKHYDGIDWAEDPKPAGPEEAEPGPRPERIQVREELAQVLASLAAELETGVDSGADGRVEDAEDAVADALRVAMEKTRGATASLPGIRPKEEDQIRQTLFLLDEVRMTLGDDRAISLRSARKALKLWTRVEDQP